MLPKPHRLHHDKEIKALLKSGRTFFLPQLIFKYQQTKDDNLKFGFVVSTKVDKRAVVRNQLERRLREIVRAELSQLAVGYSVLIIAKKKALELDFSELSKQLHFAFDKIGLYKKNHVKKYIA